LISGSHYNPAAPNEQGSAAPKRFSEEKRLCAPEKLDVSVPAALKYK
jgi:hypothetical protein